VQTAEAETDLGRVRERVMAVLEQEQWEVCSPPCALCDGGARARAVGGVLPSLRVVLRPDVSVQWGTPSVSGGTQLSGVDPRSGADGSALWVAGVQLNVRIAAAKTSSSIPALQVSGPYTKTPVINDGRPRIQVNSRTHVP
jgi:hypothetical protein